MNKAIKTICVKISNVCKGFWRGVKIIIDNYTLIKDSGDMRTDDIQQALSGFTTTAVIGGPLIVRIHKAQDVIYAESSRHGFFISVDFKFRQNDALYIGAPGWEGLSKTEATREANALAAKIASYYNTMKSAEEAALRWDTSTNRYTAKVQADRFNGLVSKYAAEFV